jgi:hypothetical protein
MATEVNAECVLAQTMVKASPFLRKILSMKIKEFQFVSIGKFLAIDHSILLI